MSEEWKAEHDRHYGTSPSPALTREALAAALHERYAAGVCISDLGLHDYDGCDAKAQWRSDADAIERALGTPPPAPTEEAK